MSQRQYNQLDRFIIKFDEALVARFTQSTPSKRPNPASDSVKARLDEKEKRVSQGLMRVNHAGEVSAQALYQGQSLTARSRSVKISMQQAADEEMDHLNWCKQRLDELETHPSYLSPLWYLGSFSIGALAGGLGDKWSLGFVAETEHQVVEHLCSHIEKLPEHDEKSRAILEQMKIDESHHASMAIESGAVELPAPIRKLMKLSSLVMTTTTYWI
jgi:ubiquinone biosynthesis monooxygenase Coq7